MKTIILFFNLFLSFSVCCLISAKCVDEPDGLILVHALFRHGNRTIANNIYDSNPFGNESFWSPYGYEQLTNEGKMKEYFLGQKLREKYGELIGKEYYPTIIEARSTETDRTKMSLELVLANLFPPTNLTKWNAELNWQPIPFITSDYDKILYGRIVCTNYESAYKKYIKTDEVLDLLKPYQKMFDEITEIVGKKIQKPKKAAKIYMELKTQLAFGYPVEDWFYQYEKELFNITMLNFRLMAAKKKMQRICAGYFLKKIIQDTKNRIENLDSPTKIFLYSAHETNIANVLVTLDVFDDEIPSFGSHILIEVHRINGDYGFKFYYQNYKESDPILLTIPGCEEFCKIEDFEEIVKDIIPDDDYCDL